MEINLYYLNIYCVMHISQRENFLENSHMPVEKKNTILSVAKAAGVGVGTVSRVLNHAPAVHPDTAAEVHAAVARLGYRLPARRHRRGPRSHGAAPGFPAGGKVLLAVLGRQGLNWMLDCAPVYVGVMHGIESALAEMGCRMLVRQAASRAELTGIVKAAAPSGVIIMGFEGEPAGEEIPASLRQIPAVWSMGSPLNFPGDHVQPDHIRVGVLGAEYLLHKGHRHCALIGSQIGSPAQQMNLRNDGFRWTITDAGGEVPMLLNSRLVRRGAHENEVDSELLSLAVAQLAAASPRPTALFLESDMLAPGIYQRLRRAGIAPQRDLEIVTCNNEAPYLAALDPRPTVVDIQPQVIGRRTVDQLAWRAGHLHAPPMRVMIEPIIVPAPVEGAKPVAKNTEFGV